ncbi:MAG: ATP-dependent sacrificial sulfur transferase LarE [Oscillibacter sp.]
MDLKDFFCQNPAGILAFSGGVDSSLLAWAAAKYGKKWEAYYLHSAFQPAFELADARKLAAEVGLPLTVLELDILALEAVAENPGNRCYFCKKAIFSAICEKAAQNGFSLVIDGTNASDDSADRPGLQALRELEIRSPLRECGWTKADVRRLSREVPLFTWDKPAYACLATRIPCGTRITAEKLRKIEDGEAALTALGFRDFRIRLQGDGAVVQLTQSQLHRAWAQREALLETLSPLFSPVTLDLKPRTPSE